METNKDDFSLIHITEDSSDCKNIEQLIVNVRGRQVMLDRDLASLYGVETKVLNQAVKRNIERFPDDFRFQLTKDECLRSQIVTFKYLPYVFTENGIAMLSSVLRSKTEIEMNIRIMRISKSHDRFLIIDEELYHIGASIKDLGKKWLAFTLMKDISPDEILQKIKSHFIFIRLLFLIRIFSFSRQSLPPWRKRFFS